jgi:hypothetical protein
LRREGCVKGEGSGEDQGEDPGEEEEEKERGWGCKVESLGGIEVSKNLAVGLNDGVDCCPLYAVVSPFPELSLLWVISGQQAFLPLSYHMRPSFLKHNVSLMPSSL